MTKQQSINYINDKIDKMIINGKTNTKEFKRLMKLHKRIVKPLATG